jgi:transposase
MGADSGGQRAASLCSLIGRAKLNGLDPAFYLRTVMATIAEHPINHIEELLSQLHSRPTLPRQLKV